jgi:predicted PurR-regulated permease PerM
LDDGILKSVRTMKKNVIKVEITYKSIVFVLLLILSVLFVYKIREMLLELFVAILITTTLNPIVNKLSKRMIPRVLAIVVVYLLMFGVLGVTIASLIPAVIDQSSKFVSGIPIYVERLGIFGPYSEQILSQVISMVSSFPGQLARFTLTAFTNVFSLLAIFIFAFYLLLYRDKLYGQLEYLLGEEKAKSINKFALILEKKLGGWARGQLMLMFIIFLTTYVGLLILGIPYALPLAILAGLLEIVPYIGPIISAIPAVIIALSISPFLGISTVILYILVQQLENYLIVPKVMQKSVGVNPIVTLLALSIGLRLAGIVGVLLSIPIVVALQVFLTEYFTAKNLNES